MLMKICLQQQMCWRGDLSLCLDHHFYLLDIWVKGHNRKLRTKGYRGRSQLRQFLNVLSMVDSMNKVQHFYFF